MAHEFLATYLNDHLAGAVFALEMLRHLEPAHAGTPLEREVAAVRTDIEADKRELEALMRRFDAPASVTRRAAAWVGEKAGDLKLRVDAPAGTPFRVLEALDIVAGGIE